MQHSLISALDPIPIVRTISNKLFKGQNIPLKNVRIEGCLVGGKAVEYLVYVGVGVVLVRQSFSTMGERWDADIVPDEDQTNTRIRFLGTGVHSEE